MDISIDNVTGYLIDRGLINMESIVEDSLKIIDVSRKNRNIKVIRKNNVSYLLKQPYASDRRSAGTIRNEAYLYYLVKKSVSRILLILCPISLLLMAREILKF